PIRSEFCRFVIVGASRFHLILALEGAAAEEVAARQVRLSLEGLVEMTDGLLVVAAVESCFAEAEMMVAVRFLGNEGGVGGHAGEQSERQRGGDETPPGRNPAAGAAGGGQLLAQRFGQFDGRLRPSGRFV